MKILIPTIGSRGDVQPYINLGQGLKKAGHQVTLASHPCMRELVSFHELDFAPVGPDIDMDQKAAELRQNTGHWMLGLMRVMRFGYSVVMDASNDILALCRDAELVIVSDSSAGSAEADKVGVPRVSVTLQPTRIPRQAPENQSTLQKISGKLIGAFMDRMLTGPFNKHRKKLGLSPLGPEGIFSTMLTLVPVSPVVFTPDPLWPDYAHLTGYWFAAEPQDWTPSADLQAFIEAGEPPAVISLGAMSIGKSDDAREAAQIAIQAVEQAGIRAIFQGWNDVIDAAGLPDNIFHARSVPHGWLLARASCITHHGGFGTTAAGLRAGIPSIVVPHIIDQFLWAQEVEKLGAGPQPIPRKELTAERWAAALTEAVQNTEMRAKAWKISEQIRSEDGIKTAIQLIGENVQK
jgi:sterol 3beta-glucosyltransferase